MNVIRRGDLRAFWERPGHRVAEKPMSEWYKLARKAAWRNFEDVKSTFGQTDAVRDTASGKTATVFDVGGNKYRIVALIDYTRQTVLITHVLDHKGYDAQRWKREI